MKKLLLLLALAAVPACQQTLNNRPTQQAQKYGIVQVVANPTTGGKVTGGGSYPRNTKVMISATPFAGWRFTRWNDNVTAATRTVTVPYGGVLYTAYFTTVPKGTVLCTNDPPWGGTIMGCGTYPVNQFITLSAIPNQNWLFDHWSDGSSNASVTFSVGQGTYAIAAYYVTNPPVVPTYGTVVLTAEPPYGGTVSGAGTYPSGRYATITATPYTNWSFLYWQDQTNTNPRSIYIYPNTTVSMAATFITNAPVYGYLNAFPVPNNGGSFLGAGSFPFGHISQLTAVPNANFRFDHWQDGGTANPTNISIIAGTININGYFFNYGTLTLTVEPPGVGIVSGAGTYAVGQVVTFSARPSTTNWFFARWQDNNTNAVRQLTIPAGNIQMTATFMTNTPVPAPKTGAKLWWDPPTGNPPMNYLLSWGLGSHNYTSITNTVPPQVFLPNLISNQTYYAAVQAVAPDGTISPFSCEVSWTYGTSNYCQ